jgi:hypothetical protein
MKMLEQYISDVCVPRRMCEALLDFLAVEGQKREALETEFASLAAGVGTVVDQDLAIRTISIDEGNYYKPNESTDAATVDFSESMIN